MKTRISMKKREKKEGEKSPSLLTGLKNQKSSLPVLGGNKVPISSLVAQE